MRRRPSSSKPLPFSAPRRDARATLVVIGALAALAAALGWPGLAAAAVCQSSTPSSEAYQVTVCITQVADGASLTGTLPVGATVSVTGSNPGIQRVVFSVDGTHLLTDYTPSYLFSLPSAKFVDGPKLLQARTMMRDGFVSEMASISVTYANGNSSPPVNPNTFTPRTGTTPAPGKPFSLVATGDGASGEPNAEQNVDTIEASSPNMFLYLGDVYEKGSQAEFFNWYGPLNSWGALHAITNPTIGNHEYEDGVAIGYFDYWDNAPHYYSFEAGPWHVASIDSNNQYEGDTVDSEQYQWLDADLAGSSAPCKMVFMHHPWLSVGPQGGNPRLNDLWALMVQRGVDVVMTAHEHHYQRWMPLDASGALDPNGATQLVAGGGGHGITGFTTNDPRLVVGFDVPPGAIGSVHMDLNPEGTSYRYVNLNGQVLDSSWLKCNGTPADATAPSAPTALQGAPHGSGAVDLSWTAATDNVAVTGYKIFRDGAQIGTSAGTTYTDSDVTPGSSHAYHVRAVDGADNTSGPSNTVNVTTLPPDQVLTFTPTDDAYISASSPAANFGSAATLQLDSTPDRAFLMKFEVSGLGGWSVTNAKLRLRNSNSSNVGGIFFRAASNSWSEGTLNWNNAPATDGAQLAALGGVSSGNWYEVPVTPAVTGDGTFSFRVTTTSTDGADYVSAEGLAGFAPELVVTATPPANPDTEPPTAPTGLSAEAISGTRVDLAWTASSDNEGVAGYRIYRNGVEIDNTSGTVYSDLTTSPAQAYTYVVRARDATGNLSDPSNEASATTPAPDQVLTFTTTADAYVSASSTSKNYGTVTALKLDASPDKAILLKFALSGIGPWRVTDAKLRVHNVASSASGGSFHKAASSSWTESGVTWANAPAAAAGPALGTLGQVSSGNWYEVPVTAAVTGDGALSFRINPLSADGADYASKEAAGGLAAQLVVTISPPLAPDTEPPSAPTGLATTAVTSTHVDLTWNASTDNVGVTGYKVFRNGAEIASTPQTSWSDGTVGPSQSYAYHVVALDGTNTSGPSNTLNVTTPAPDQVLTFSPSDDAYLSSSSPNSNFGAATTLQADFNPDRAFLLKFAVSGIPSGWTVTNAKLRLRNTNSSNKGGDFHLASSNAWTEGAVTWNTAPLADPIVLATLGQVSSGNWYEVPVTAGVPGAGTVSFRVDTNSTDGADYASKEGLAGMAPQLVVTITPPTP